MKPSSSVIALYGVQLKIHANNGSTDHRGVAAPQMEEFENQVE
jgi:hypothetical protein